jgi:hypothetical protein
MNDTFRQYGLYLFFSLFIAHGIMSAPISNTTSTDSQVESNSSLIGIIQLLETCVATLSLAVYSALHLNVDPSRSWWTGVWIKLRWMFVGMVAPEVVLWTAIGQLIAALKVRKTAKEIEKARGRGNSKVKSWKFLH